MPVVPAQYPDQVWDGKSRNPWRESIHSQVDPDFNDWDQVVAEVRATQEELDAQVSGGIEALAGEAISAGQPVYIKQSTQQSHKAQSTLEEKSRVCGFCRVDSGAGENCSIVPAGRLEVADWSIPLGGPSLLTPGAIYYLSDISGQITESPPSAGFVVQVGVAVTTTILAIGIKVRVRL